MPRWRERPYQSEARCDYLRGLGLKPPRFIGSGATPIHRGVRFRTFQKETNRTAQNTTPVPQHRKTKTTYNTPGHAHALTFSCYKRLPLLSVDPLRRLFLDALAEARIKQSFQVWAYVLMPEHVHLFLYPTSLDYDMAKIESAIKQGPAFHGLNWLLENWPEMHAQTVLSRPERGRNRRFWQDGSGYDRNQWSAEKTWSWIRYLHANPVRRGLVECAGDWPWSSARSYEEVRPVEFEVDRCPVIHPDCYRGISWSRDAMTLETPLPLIDGIGDEGCR